MGKVNSVIIENVTTGEREELPCDAVFVFVGMDPRTELASLAKQGASLEHLGDRIHHTANTFRLPAYTTLDLHAEVALSRQWTLQTQWRNVTDERYETVRGYNQPPRGVFVTLRWQPRPTK